MLDLFGENFKFKLKNGKFEQKTNFGFFLSIIIIALSLAYLIYLLVVFFENSIPPAVSQLIESQKIDQTISINYSPLVFKIASDTEIQDINKYFSVQAMMVKNNKFKQQSINLVKCTDGDNQRSALQCLDSTDLLTLTTAIDPSQSTQIQIQISRCNNVTGACVSDDVFNSLIADYNFHIILGIRYMEYDTMKQKLELRTDYDIYDIDPNLITFTKVNLYKSKINIDQGFLLSDRKEYQYIYNYKILNEYYTKQFFDYKYQTATQNFLKVIRISLESNVQLKTVVYAKISQVLAEFSSIFNLLMSLGILGKLYSQKFLEQNIGEEIFNQQYKISTKQRFEQQQENIDQITTQQIKDNNKDELQQIKNKSSDAVAQKNGSQNILVNFNFIFLLKYTWNTFYKKKKPQIQQDQLQSKEITDQNIENQSEQQQFYYYTQQQKLAEQFINVNELLNDIVFMKMALQLLFSEQQYAALSFCRKKILEQHNSTSLDIESVDKIQNHLNKVDAINTNQQYKAQQYESFIQKVKKNDQVNELDTRIYHSLIEVNE